MAKSGSRWGEVVVKQVVFDIDIAGTYMVIFLATT
jgi:hypothetical protein